MPLSRKALHFWPVVVAVFLTDCATKSLAEHGLARAHGPRAILGEFIRFTLVYNDGAAMSLNLGSLSRPILTSVALIALTLLLLWYRRTRPEATAQLVALGLVWAGAAGNLWDRLRSSRGVVDFIDLGLGTWRFWIFNVGDIAITLGALWLALLLARQAPPDGAV
jgi:signal peptidase II